MKHLITLFSVFLMGISLAGEANLSEVSPAAEYLDLKIEYDAAEDSITVTLKNITDKELKVWSEPTMLKGRFNVSRDGVQIGQLYDKDWFRILATGLRPPHHFTMKAKGVKEWTYQVNELKKSPLAYEHRDFNVSSCKIFLTLDAGIRKSTKTKEGRLEYKFTEIHSKPITIPKR